MCQKSIESDGRESRKVLFADFLKSQRRRRHGGTAPCRGTGRHQTHAQRVPRSSLHTAVCLARPHVPPVRLQCPTQRERPDTHPHKNTQVGGMRSGAGARTGHEWSAGHGVEHELGREAGRRRSRCVRRRKQHFLGAVGGRWERAGISSLI